MTDNALHTYTYGPYSKGKPKSLVVLLHGLGADGQDLIGLGEEWGKDLPDTVFVSPDAPFPCDLAPYGRQWFSLRDWSPQSMEQGAKDVSPLLDGFLDSLLHQYGLTDDVMALVGFSQGAMTALYVGTRRAKRFAGILGYSGALVGEAGDTLVPVSLIHGAADTVVPPQALQDAATRLSQKGFAVDSKLVPGLPHGIDKTGLGTGLAFLKRVLPQ